MSLFKGQWTAFPSPPRHAAVPSTPQYAAVPSTPQYAAVPSTPQYAAGTSSSKALTLKEGDGAPVHSGWLARDAVANLPLPPSVASCFVAEAQSRVADLTLRVVGRHEQPVSDFNTGGQEAGVVGKSFPAAPPRWQATLVQETDLTTLPGVSEQLLFRNADPDSYLQVRWRRSSAPNADYRVSFRPCSPRIVQRELEAQRLKTLVHRLERRPEVRPLRKLLLERALASESMGHRAAVAAALDRAGDHERAGRLWPLLAADAPLSRLEAATNLQQRQQPQAARATLCALLKQLAGRSCAVATANTAPVSTGAEGSLTQHAEGSLTQQAEGSLTQQAEGSLTQQAEGSLSQQAEGSLTQHAEGSLSQHAEGSLSEEAEGSNPSGSEWVAGQLLRLANRLGLLALDQAAFAEAERWFDLADQTGALVSWPEQEARVLNNRAGLALQRGQQELAALYFSEALTLLELSGDRAGLASVLANLGTLDERAGRFELARSALRQALNIFGQVRDPLGEALTRCRLGQLYGRLGGYVEASAQLQQGQLLLVAEGDVGLAARCALSEGLLLRQRQERSAARRKFSRAQALARRAGDLVTATRALIGIYSVETQAQSRNALRQAQVAIESQSLTALRSDLQEARAQVAERRGDFAEAQKQWQNIAQSVSLNSARWVECQLQSARLTLRLGDLSRALQLLEPLQKKLAPDSDPAAVPKPLLLQGPEVVGQRRTLATLLSRALRLRAQQATEAERAQLIERSLLALTQAQEVPDPALLAGSFARTGRAALAELVDARQRSLDPEQRARLTALLEQQRAQLTAQASFSGMKPTARSLHLPALPASTAWVQFHGDEEELVAWIWHQGRLQLVTYQQPATVAELLIRARGAVRSQAPAREALRALGRTLFEPLLPMLADVRRLRLVADGPLLGLPLASLLIPIASKSAGDSAGTERWQHVGERFELYTALRWNQVLQPLPNQPESALLVGVSEGSGALPPLPYVAQEVAAVQSLLTSAGTQSARTLIGAQATRARVLASMTAADMPKLIHVAAHGVSNPRAAVLSGLHLNADGGTDRARAGFVGYEDLASLRLAAELVVLSACETALNSERAGAAGATLAAAFGHAGVPWVLASHWAVDDRATAQLMNGFYRHWLAGQDPVAALALAQGELRARPELRHPVFWAGFELMQVR